MRIYLADLAHTATVDDRSIPVPLNIGYISAYAKGRFGDRIETRLFKHPDLLLKEALRHRPDVIGLSNYGWSQDLTSAVGTALDERLPGTVFVAGGPNIDQTDTRLRTFLRRNAWIDFLVLDAGEEPFTELISQLMQGRRPEDEPPADVAILRGDVVMRSRRLRKLTKAIDDIPSPYLTGELDEFLGRGMVPLFETNRGCPFSCTFCAWGDAAKNLVRRFPLDQSVAEIEYVAARSDANAWILCDANFGILERDVEIAKRIRRARDESGHPKWCHTWLAKNVTERNLEIGRVLGDMTVPVMAVQSLDDEVLRNIKRSNISTDTYVRYQQAFHRIGSRTYSDMIVPLPGETLESHLAGLRSLFSYGVDQIACHNMRMLAGAEANSDETRRRFAFRTRYRLIHGDAGIYGRELGLEVRSFEVEESLRSTSTMSEADMFYLRKLHFLVECFWNDTVYKSLLRVMALYGVNQVDVLATVLRVCEEDPTFDVDQASLRAVRALFRRFDEASYAEWFDSEDAIRAFFARPERFRRLLDQEFEKLNIQFTIELLRTCKEEMDKLLLAICRSFAAVPDVVLGPVAAYTFAIFPALLAEPRSEVFLPADLIELNERTAATYRAEPTTMRCTFRIDERRDALRAMLLDPRGRTVSKILNTQALSLETMRLVPSIELRFEDLTETPVMPALAPAVKGSWRNAAV